MKYSICNKLSGADLGIFDASSPTDALEVMAKDAGYATYSEACDVAPVEDGEISAIEVDADFVVEMQNNQDVILDFFKGIASCDYYDGMSYQLYLDLHDMSLSIHQEASDQNWLQRDDGSLVQIHRVSGYCDIPKDERYTDECDIMDYGYSEWIDEVKAKIESALNPLTNE